LLLPVQTSLKTFSKCPCFGKNKKAPLSEALWLVSAYSIAASIDRNIFFWLMKAQHFHFYFSQALAGVAELPGAAAA
jgi:hypothetical protein